MTETPGTADALADTATDAPPEARAGVPADVRRAPIGARQLKAFIRDDYDAVGPLWEPWLGRYFRFPAQRLTADLRPRPGNRCLDLACGSALVARAFARVVGPGLVSACDLSPGQVEAARSVLAAAGLAEIEVRVMDAEQLAYPPGSFDRLGCGFGINHFPRPASAVRGVFRVLAPGGRAGFTVWGPAPALARERVEQRLAELLPSPDDDERRCGAALERAVVRNSRPEPLAAMIERAGFVRVAVRRHAFVVDFVDAGTLVDTVLAREERAVRHAGLDAHARERLRTDLIESLAGLDPRMYRVRRLYVAILGTKPR
jgi:ubiquinone/menaquinone biosynthesis C-methylase UbiE